jgi:hypothetical protein
MRRFVKRIAIAANIGPPQIISKNDNDVGLLSRVHTSWNTNSTHNQDENTRSTHFFAFNLLPALPFPAHGKFVNVPLQCWDLKAVGFARIPSCIKTPGILANPTTPTRSNMKPRAARRSMLGVEHLIS